MRKSPLQNRDVQNQICGGPRSIGKGGIAPCRNDGNIWTFNANVDGILWVRMANLKGTVLQVKAETILLDLLLYYQIPECHMIQVYYFFYKGTVGLCTGKFVINTFGGWMLMIWLISFCMEKIRGRLNRCDLDLQSGPCSLKWNNISKHKNIRSIPKSGAAHLRSCCRFQAGCMFLQCRWVKTKLGSCWSSPDCKQS